MSTITIYSNPNCVQCDATYRFLFAAGIDDFDVIMVEDNEEARKYVMETLGYRQAPVVVDDEGHWSGYRPDKLKSYKDRLVAQGAVLTPCDDRDRVTSKIKALKAMLALGVPVA